MRLLTDFSHELSVHTAIEIVAIIVAAILVRRIERTYGRLRAGLLNFLARRNQRVAKARIFKLIGNFLYVVESEKVEALIIRTSVENLRVTLYSAFAVLMAVSLPEELGWLPGLIVFFVVWLKYNKYVRRREDQLDLLSFTQRTKDQILKLRPYTDPGFDGELGLWWQKSFGEALLSRDRPPPALLDHEEP